MDIEKIKKIKNLLDIEKLLYLVDISTYRKEGKLFILFSKYTYADKAINILIKSEIKTSKRLSNKQYNEYFKYKIQIF